MTVWIKVGLCTIDSFINIALCTLGYIPGLLHAWYIIARHPETDVDYEPIDGAERGERVTNHDVHDCRGELHSGYGAIGGGETSPQQLGKPAPPAPSARPASGGSAAAGPSEAQGGAPPPSYTDAVKGDHKIQTLE